MKCQVRQLTSAGRGAVAVLQVCTDSPTKVLDTHFTSASGVSLADASVNRILYGTWQHEDVVVVRTGNDIWEIQCHGGDAAVSRIKRMLSEDSPECQPDQSLTDRILQQLQQCRTLRTANYLHGQLTALPKWIGDYRSADLPEKSRLLAELAGWQDFADRLTSSWRVAIVGQPNAGKSSLLNAILGFDRAIVYDQPGTTRDRVSAEIVLDGWPITLYDTAGIRTTVDGIEKMGVEQAMDSMQTCDACLVIKDASQPWTEADERLITHIPTDTPTALVLNKTDLGRCTIPDSFQSVTLETVAIQSQGIEDLLGWIPEAILPQIPATDTALPVVDLLLLQDFAGRLTEKEDDHSS